MKNIALSPRIRNPKDFFSGLIFLGIGILGAWIARNYSFGTPVRMGPGFLPTGLSYITTILGLVIMARAMVTDGEGVSRIVWRPLIMVLAGIAAFGLLIQEAGLVITTMVSVAVGGAAAPDLRLWEMLLLGAGLALFSVLVFVVGLGQAMPIWWFR